jgi:hypothetical protein
MTCGWRTFALAERSHEHNLEPCDASDLGRRVNERRLNMDYGVVEILAKKGRDRRVKQAIQNGL